MSLGCCSLRGDYRRRMVEYGRDSNGSLEGALTLTEMILTI